MFVYESVFFSSYQRCKGAKHCDEKPKRADLKCKWLRKIGVRILREFFSSKRDKKARNYEIFKKRFVYLF
jgi:hypothetical protein